MKNWSDLTPEMREYIIDFTEQCAEQALRSRRGAGVREELYDVHCTSWNVLAKQMNAAAALQPCHCLFRHPNNEDERKQVIKALEYARSVGDSHGITLALTQLGPCPSKMV